MKLLKNTINGYRYLHWTFCRAFSHFIKGLARELNTMSIFFLKWHTKIVCKAFSKKWMRTNEYGTTYFDINGAKLPDISKDENNFSVLAQSVFEDVFLISCFYNDNYDKKVVDFLDQYMLEGPYGYQDGEFSVTLQKDDVVIDAGAWIGDFSAYAASKGAIVYAFEPTDNLFSILSETAELNQDKIVPIKKGLGNIEGELTLYKNDNSVANSFVIKEKDAIFEEKIQIIELDKFIEENKLKRVDFIKADIEGAERDLLKGATQVLKKFAPKLAICTYHLPDDPEVLERLIKEANPNYKVVQLRHKLFAAVTK
jgi:FkbM family methyltransferase